jgi:hypothetical protein
MTNREKQALRQAKLRDAMLPLLADPRFAVFMDEVADQQRVAMLDACHERTVANDRLLSTALGEVRAYQGILDLYNSYKEQAEQTTVE